MDKKRDINMLVMCIIVMILLLSNAIYNIAFIFDFSKQKENGNEKWLMVEKRLVSMEKQINELTKEE